MRGAKPPGSPGSVLRRLFFARFRQQFRGPGNLIISVLEMVGIATAWLTVPTLLIHFRAFAAGYPSLSSYLWTTFLFMLLVIPAWLWVARVLYRTATSARESGEAARVQHRLAEAVRSCASRLHRHLEFDCQNELQRALGAPFDKYLRLRLGNRVYSVTLKIVERDPNRADGRRLRVVFRDHDQKRPGRESISTDESYVFKSIIAPASPVRRFVAARDVQQLNVSHDDFKQFSAKAGVGSVLAIALRMPLNVPDTETSSILGLLVVDSPDVGAFDQLFMDEPKIGDNEYQDVEPFPDIEFFYGIADAVATICMMKYWEMNQPSMSMRVPAGSTGT